MQLLKPSEVTPNPSNPRVIRDDKFFKLVQSLKDFPEMANVRPIVINSEHVILGGNMRYRAMVEAGWKQIPVEAVDWSEDKQREFTIKDNASFGDWDWDVLANEWDAVELAEWGITVWQPEAEADYSLLDDDDSDGQLQDMANGVKKAIQIEFDPEHYDEAYGLVKFWREQGANVGKMILDFLKHEKAKV